MQYLKLTVLIFYRELQERYGTPTSPTEFVLVAGKTPLGDIDYQKVARQTVVGELSRLILIPTKLQI